MQDVRLNSPYFKGGLWKTEFSGQDMKHILVIHTNLPLNPDEALYDETPLRELLQEAMDKYSHFDRIDVEPDPDPGTF